FQQVCEELRLRLRRSDSCGAEDYFESFPALALDPSWAFKLLRIELSTRRELGQKITLEQWLERFPQWEELLRSLFNTPTGSLDSGVALMTRVPEGRADGASPRTSEIPVPASLDHHELLEEIGKGGMGVVHRAWDPILKRHVALKRIRAGA